MILSMFVVGPVHRAHQQLCPAMIGRVAVEYGARLILHEQAWPEHVRAALYLQPVIVEGGGSLAILLVNDTPKSWLKSPSPDDTQGKLQPILALTTSIHSMGAGAAKARSACSKCRRAALA